MATDLIRYDVLVQQALRSVVRKVLSDGARDGLPGGHHFYISFDTNAPGVKITPRLRDMYPEEMTIVLQHQYWDLSVTDTLFEVSLSFEKIPERLVVPFDAITGFFDPSVKFGLKFEAVTGEATETSPAPPTKDRKPAKVKSDNPDEPVQIGRKPRVTPKEMPPAPAPVAQGEQGPQPEAAEAKDGKDAGTAEVVSLDAFRKKK
ncbi:MAG: SspB family protein [Albidovulum sp.]